MTITYSCGCTSDGVGDIGVSVRYGSENCDAVDGFVPCVIHASYCPSCAAEVEAWPECIRSEAEEDEWLDKGPNYQRWRASAA